MSANVITIYKSPNHSSRGGKAPSILVIHATAGGLKGSIDWLCNPANRVSAHYVISKTGQVYQLVDEDRAAWHAGNALWDGHTDINERSIGIEIANANDGRDPYPD